MDGVRGRGRAPFDACFEVPLKGRARLPTGDTVEINRTAPAVAPVAPPSSPGSRGAADFVRALGSALAAPSDAAVAAGGRATGTAWGVPAGDLATEVTLGRMLAGLAGAPVGMALGTAPTAAPAAPGGAALGIGRTVRPLAAAVGSGFGPRVHPVHGDVRDHAGVDIGAPSGTPIQSFAAGTVTFAGPRGGYGNLVIVDHGDGVTTRYAHQQDVHVAVGERVAAGQVLGTVGATGTATGPHLHFEIRRDGTAVDPHPYLQ